MKTKAKLGPYPFLESNALSWGAKGVLMKLLCSPVLKGVDSLRGSKDGQFRVRGFVDELISAGYVHRMRPDGTGARRVVWYVASPTPVSENEAKVLCMHMARCEVASWIELGAPAFDSKWEKQRAYVYMLKEPVRGWVKIGSSIEPQDRQRSIQSTSGTNLIQVFLCYTFRGVEGRLHQVFAHKRVLGEWFKLDQADVEYARTLIPKLESEP